MINKQVVLVVLNDFRNDSRVLKESQSLLNNGYDVKVLALHDADLKEYDQVSKVPVYRMKLLTKKLPKYKFFKFFKYIEFLFRASFFCAKSDIIHCNDLNALPVGYLVKKIINKNVKIVYDAHEYESEVLGLGLYIKYFIKFLESKLLVCADKVITVSDSIADEYVKNYSIKKPALVHNCPPFALVEKQNKFREYFGIRSDQVIFLYQGSLGPGRGIEILKESFEKIYTDKAVLIFMGYGQYQDLVKKWANSNPNIFYHNAVSIDVLLQYTSSADYGISFTEDTCLNHRYCLPNKIFEYLMAGIPILVSNLPEMRKFVESNNIGAVVHENSIDGYVSTIKEALNGSSDDFSKNCNLAKKIYNWEQQEKILLGLYSDL
jgi:glycosyltransferase involved in cell wall biosynthesis